MHHVSAITVWGDHDLQTGDQLLFLIPDKIKLPLRGGVKTRLVDSVHAVELDVAGGMRLSISAIDRRSSTVWCECGCSPSAFAGGVH